MTFRNFLAEAIILEGGAAIKGSHALTQAEAREVIASVMHDLKVVLKLPSSKLTTVGSAGLKPGDQLSGDIDIAVEADIAAVKKAVEELALDGRFRHMPGLNVYSYAKLHGSKVAQVDIIPTTNLKLAKWAYYNDPGDIKLGLKGSHRNELLFAIAKFAELKSLSKAADGTDSARIRLVFDLSRGLYRYTQDRNGKRGLTKSFATKDKVLITSDPDQICKKLLGVNGAQAMTFADVLKVMLAPGFIHRAHLKQIIDRAISGLEGKKLVVPHELRGAIISESLHDAYQYECTRKDILKLQQRFIEDLPDDITVKVLNVVELELSKGGYKVVIAREPELDVGFNIDSAVTAYSYKQVLTKVLEMFKRRGLTEAEEQGARKFVLKIQQEAIDRGYEYNLFQMNQHISKRHYDALGSSITSKLTDVISASGFELELDDGMIEQVTANYQEALRSNQLTLKRTSYANESDISLEGFPTRITFMYGHFIIWCNQAILTEHEISEHGKKVIVRWLDANTQYLNENN